MRIIEAFQSSLDTLKHLPDLFVAAEIYSIQDKLARHQVYFRQVIVGFPSGSEMLSFRINAFDLSAKEFVNPILNCPVFFLV